MAYVFRRRFRTAKPKRYIVGAGDSFPAVPSVAGVGVAGTIGGQVDKPFTGAVGVGVAGNIPAAPTPSLVGVAGTGVAGSLSGSVATILIGVASTGVARSVIPQPGGVFAGVSGTGTAGFLTALVAPNVQQAVGIGVAGTALGQSTAPSLAGAIGVGVAGTFSSIVTYQFPGAAGIGRAGQITIIISGGGGGAAATGAGDRRRKAKTGLEPVKKRPPEPPVAVEAPKLPLPPFKDAPALVPAIEAPEIAKRPAAPSAMAMLHDQIEAAKHASDAARQLRADEQAIASFLRDDDQDQQDAEDIADILALLD